LANLSPFTKIAICSGLEQDALFFACLAQIVNERILLLLLLLGTQETLHWLSVPPVPGHIQNT
jgi:hypothetical protein